MSVETLLLFIPACFALNLAPGPNNLLSVSNATRYGFWTASGAGVGRQLAFAGMIAIAAAGLATVLQTSILLFYVIKVIGAVYLFYLAFQLWRASPTADEGHGAIAAKQNIHALARQEFFVAVGNPKAILIFTAFLPQFVDLSKPAGPQFAILGLLFLGLECFAIAAYAYIGSHLRSWFAEPERQRVFNRICASLLGVAGIGLLAARKSTAGS
ncbi:MAG: LysE family translocator [Alcaligenaceae bacterium]|nr:LysE family translocator [Alcaligenaceae bacterium]